MGKYDDILYLDYPTPHTRKRMTMSDRAAQFSAFAALTGYDEAIEETARLTGYDEAIEETARLTDPKALLSEDEQNEIGEKLAYLKEKMSEKPFVRIVFFVPDALKSGGRYVQAEGEVRKIREFEKKILLSGGEEISFDDILFIDTDNET